jgi:hypothetical protein
MRLQHVIAVVGARGSTIAFTAHIAPVLFLWSKVVVVAVVVAVVGAAVTTVTILG